MSASKKRRDLLLPSIDLSKEHEDFISNDYSRNFKTLNIGTIANNTISTANKVDIASYSPTNTENKQNVNSSRELTNNNIKRVILIGKMTLANPNDFINIFHSVDDTNYYMGQAVRGQTNPIDNKNHFVMEMTDFARYFYVGNTCGSSVSNIELNYILLN